VIAAVAMIVAGALIALALLGRDTRVSVLTLLASGIIAMIVGGTVFVQAWIWSQRSWQAGFSGRAVAISVAGGLAILLVGTALAATVILLLTFGLG